MDDETRAALTRMEEQIVATHAEITAMALVAALALDALPRKSWEVAYDKVHALDSPAIRRATAKNPVMAAAIKRTVDLLFP